MTVASIPVDQRVIDIDSRRFASVEKALVELITNSDDSYARLERNGARVSGRILVRYERHQAGAVLAVADQAEGMSFETASSILTYGGAHSPLARGEGGGRGYFGRGLKQAVYGLGHGWIETIHAGGLSRIDLFRGEDGSYLYDDGGGSRPAQEADRERLDMPDNGTRVTIVIDNAHVSISQYRTVLQALADNVYLRDLLTRRDVEVMHSQQGKVVERSGRVRFEEPAAHVLLGPDMPGGFTHEQQTCPFTLTLKRALDAELTLKGDERTNGLVVLSGMAVLDCQLFDFENQVGTEYLFGTVDCPALSDMLGQGVAIISDEREGLNHKDPFVQAFARSVSDMIAPCVLAEQEALKHLERATTSGRTGHMIEHLLHRMSQAAVQDLGIVLPASTGPGMDGAPVVEDDAARPAALRFTTPFYYRSIDHPFHATLLVDARQLSAEDVLSFDYALPASMRIEPAPAAMPVGELDGAQRIEWTIVGEAPDRGEITVRAGAHWAWCEIVVAEHAPRHGRGGAAHAAKHRVPRDHGTDMFMGYEFRNLGNDVDRAVYRPDERKIIINTAAPTVQLYVDGRGYFRDSARLLLAELFMDVISDELARRIVEKSGRQHDVQAWHAAKLAVIRRYGSDIHLSFSSK